MLLGEGVRCQIKWTVYWTVKIHNMFKWHVKKPGEIFCLRKAMIRNVSYRLLEDKVNRGLSACSRRPDMCKVVIKDHFKMKLLWNRYFTYQIHKNKGFTVWTFYFTARYNKDDSVSCSFFLSQCCFPDKLFSKFKYLHMWRRIHTCDQINLNSSHCFPSSPWKRGFICFDKTWHRFTAALHELSVSL